jgi:hypothetical protein
MRRITSRRESYCTTQGHSPMVGIASATVSSRMVCGSSSRSGGLSEGPVCGAGPVRWIVESSPNALLAMLFRGVFGRQVCARRPRWTAVVRAHAWLPWRFPRCFRGVVVGAPCGGIAELDRGRDVQGSVDAAHGCCRYRHVSANPWPIGTPPTKLGRRYRGARCGRRAVYPGEIGTSAHGRHGVRDGRCG